MEVRADGRKDEQRDGIENKDGAERDGHFLVGSLKNRADRGDGAAAANCRTRGDQIGSSAANGNQLSDQIASRKREADAEGGVEKSAAARLQHLMEIHAETECNHRCLQEKLG